MLDSDSDYLQTKGFWSLFDLIGRGGNTKPGAQKFFYLKYFPQ